MAVGHAAGGPTPAGFVAAARTYVGVGYRHLGRDRTRGLDCGGLVLCAAHAVGCLAGVDYRSYGRRPDLKRTLRRIVARHTTAVPFAERRAGDLMLFNGSERLPCHLAIVTETEPATLIVHAWADFGRVVEHALYRFPHAPVGCFRFPEFDIGASRSCRPAGAGSPGSERQRARGGNKT